MFQKFKKTTNALEVWSRRRTIDRAHKVACLGGNRSISVVGVLEFVKEL
jgi:hypothetical protein